MEHRAEAWYRRRTSHWPPASTVLAAERGRLLGAAVDEIRLWGARR